MLQLTMLWIPDPFAGGAGEWEAEYFAFYTGWPNSMAGLGLTPTSVIIQIF